MIGGKKHTTDAEYMHESLHKRRALFNMHKQSALALYTLNKNNYTKLVFSIVRHYSDKFSSPIKRIGATSTSCAVRSIIP